ARSGVRREGLGLAPVVCRITRRRTGHGPTISENVDLTRIHPCRTLLALVSYLRSTELRRRARLCPRPPAPARGRGTTSDDEATASQKETAMKNSMIIPLLLGACVSLRVLHRRWTGALR